MRRSVSRRPTISMQPISMMRCPSRTSRPVVSVSSTTCLKTLSPRRLYAVLDSFRQRFFYSAVCQRIGAFVAFIARVAAYPAPLDVMAHGLGGEALPEIDVLDRL